MDTSVSAGYHTKPFAVIILSRLPKSSPVISPEGLNAIPCCELDSIADWSKLSAGTTLHSVSRP